MDPTQKIEFIFSPSKRFNLVTAILECLGFGGEKSESFPHLNRDLDDEFFLDKSPAAEKDAVSSPVPESDPPAADLPLTEAAPRVQNAVVLPDVPTPGGSTGSGGQHN